MLATNVCIYATLYRLFQFYRPLNLCFLILVQSYVFKSSFHIDLQNIQLIQLAFYLAKTFGSYRSIYLRSPGVFMARQILDILKSVPFSNKRVAKPERIVRTDPCFLRNARNFKASLNCFSAFTGALRPPYHLIPI